MCKNNNPDGKAGQRCSKRMTAPAVSWLARPQAVAAFTLTELMIVVALIALLATIAIPYFVHARNASQVRACITNLRRLEDAKSQWAIETKQRDTAFPTTNNIVPYLGYNKMPVCPSKGTYRVRRLTANPSCSRSAVGHSLGNFNMDDDPAFD